MIGPEVPVIVYMDKLSNINQVQYTNELKYRMHQMPSSDKSQANVSYVT